MLRFDCGNFFKNFLFAVIELKPLVLPQSPFFTSESKFYDFFYGNSKSNNNNNSNNNNKNKNNYNSSNDNNIVSNSPLLQKTKTNK